MPITYIDIEKQKSWRIAVLFLVLVLLYFVLGLAMIFAVFDLAGIATMFNWEGAFTPGKILILFFYAFLIAAIHFIFSASDMIQRVKKHLVALEPDPDDELHKRLMNIMDEVRVVTGNRAKIECVVIPSLSMNALSAIDLKRNAVIAITEGLVSRLTRDQLEAVVAHEAHHILSGDCLESSIAASLFGIPAAFIEKVSVYTEGRAFFSPGFIFMIILLKLSQLLNLFVSREREYRADAGAVHMTRNPLALAEVLHLLSRNWRGMGFIGSGLQSLCIVNTRISKLDESEGWMANMFSTHPPIRKRIKVLLNMARATVADLEYERKKKRGSVIAPKDQTYYALDTKYQWQGPFTVTELALLPWFRSLTWVSKDGEAMEKASEVPFLNDLFLRMVDKDPRETSDLSCPYCHDPLLKERFDRTGLFVCRFCGGRLVEGKKVSRIIARSTGDCSDRIRTIARVTLRENQLKRIAKHKKGSGQAVPAIHCPKCNNLMLRTFYSLAYLIEIDRCTVCDLVWFDQDELRMLQCMIDGKMASEEYLPL